MENYFAFIFARGGSKGIPDKNLQTINNLSLVAHSIELALSLNNIERIFLSTDSEQISRVGKDYSIEIINRPSKLASDNANELLAWKHAINHVESLYGPFSRFLSIPPTSPLRIKQDVEGIMNKLYPDIDLVLGITKSRRNPWFNMVIRNDGIKVVNSNLKFHRRQDAPTIYDITTVAYASFVSYLKDCSNLLEGKIDGYEIPEERAVDIDTKLDLEIARFLMNRIYCK